MAQSSYYVGYQIAYNPDLLYRVAAAAQQEAERVGISPFDPEAWAQTHRWEWGTQTDWVSAVQAAQETGVSEWGKQPNVVTDQMILSWVQPALIEPPPPPAAPPAPEHKKGN